MTLKSELVMRAKTIHRKAWLDMAGTVGPHTSVYLKDGVTVNGVKIERVVGSWVVTLIDEEVIVYYEPMGNAGSISKRHLLETVKKLRAAMILDDLASI